MGYDATIYFPKGTLKKDIYEQLFLLGYKKQTSIKYNVYFYKYNINDYKHNVGVFVLITESSEKDISFTAWVRTQIDANRFDLQYQNTTIKHLKKHFNAYFVSDYGKNRYFPYDYKESISEIENGCFFALENFYNKFKNFEYSISKYPEDSESEMGLQKFGILSPSVFNANVYTSFLCSMFENYFRETFLVLLIFSEKKEKIFKEGNKLSAFDMKEISLGNVSIEQAFTSNLSFQNIKKTCLNYKLLDSKFDIEGCLKKPFRRRKENLFDTAHRILEHRHNMVHKLNYNIGYTHKNLIRDAYSMKEIITRTYKHICKLYDWQIRSIL